MYDGEAFTVSSIWKYGWLQSRVAADKRARKKNNLHDCEVCIGYLPSLRCSCTGKTRPVRIETPSRGAARRYDSYGRVFPVHEHRKTRLVSDLHNGKSNLEVKSFKFDAMQ